MMHKSPSKPSYRIAGKFDKVFNLAIWRSRKNRQI